ncbi:hypothetical protein PTSG_10072 [Salpingoeca rosetta]|uniref:Uncharacterized protein n=1 Tax=Salpingoeca rosetta (strain ATCC 50818 / BSB-021) TaxID=946362 RepID=F2UPE7_SALR5|nr:uncharacterized protein PTSG_10072 [Salpingoeca rosetta]EGD79502.1 hypothetical protein PTSG_10072 [Salpingoeca rosetta]|eukprot:XP_004988983.1 hypothetical protein PTSG_10072 [Salpingoeca rosetta]
MGDDGYSLPQDTVPDFRNVPKPQRDSEYSEPQLWNPLQPRSRKDTEDDDDDYDDADLSIKKRGQDFIDSARRLAKRDDERKKSGYVDVDIDKIMANRANQGACWFWVIDNYIMKIETTDRDVSPFDSVHMRDLKAHNSDGEDGTLSANHSAHLLGLSEAHDESDLVILGDDNDDDHSVHARLLPHA